MNDKHCVPVFFPRLFCGFSVGEALGDPGYVQHLAHVSAKQKANNAWPMIRVLKKCCTEPGSTRRLATEKPLANR
jgi:hypothetical protein